MLTDIKRLFKRNSLLLAVIITVSIAFLSLMHIGNQIPIPKISNVDKVEHAFAYFVLTLIWLLALGKTKKRQLLIVLSCIVYGVLMEFLQFKLTTYRTADYLDAIANTTGILLALLSYRLFFAKTDINC